MSFWDVSFLKKFPPFYTNYKTRRHLSTLYLPPPIYPLPPSPISSLPPSLHLLLPPPNYLPRPLISPTFLPSLQLLPPHLATPLLPTWCHHQPRPKKWVFFSLHFSSNKRSFLSLLCFEYRYNTGSFTLIFLNLRLNLHFRYSTVYFFVAGVSLFMAWIFDFCFRIKTSIWKQWTLAVA